MTIWPGEPYETNNKWVAEVIPGTSTLSAWTYDGWRIRRDVTMTFPFSVVNPQGDDVTKKGFSTRRSRPSPLRWKTLDAAIEAVERDLKPAWDKAKKEQPK